MHHIETLKGHIQSITDAKESIISRWISYEEVSTVLVLHSVDINYFAAEYAHAVLGYYINIVNGTQQIGDCPVIARLLQYLKEKNIAASELFVICTHFRKSMIAEMYEKGNMSWELYDAISFVFDENFRGVLQHYSETIYEAQEETKRQSSFLSQFNAAIGESALVSRTDLSGKITYVNDKFCEVSGYSREELLGVNHNVIRDGSIPKEIYKELWETIQNKKVYKGVLKNRSKNGEAYFVEATVLPLYNLEGKVIEYLAIRYEVSELVKARNTAIETEQFKSKFLSTMSHEIRTPMSGILGMAHLALQTDLNKEQRNYIEVIDNCGKSLLSIINDILDFSKIEAGKLNIEYSNFSLSKTVENVLDIMNFQAKEKELDLIINDADIVDKYFHGDSLRIGQILTNLIGNAIKFTAKGSVCLRVSQVSSKRMRFEVIDTGIGITPQQQENLFKSFSQADSATTRKFGGTGLGLSISKQLVALMDGKIWVESEEDIGSKFIFEINLDELSQDQYQEIPEGKHLESHIPNLKGHSILVVEDNLTNQLVVQGLLEESEVKIDIANDGKEAVSMYQNNPAQYELILMDLQMPIMDGFEATKEIRKDDLQVPIFALTANVIKEEVNGVYEAGMNGYLSKPIDLEKLYEVLETYLLEQSD